MTLSIPFTHLDPGQSRRTPSSKSIETALGVLRQPNPLLFAAADAVSADHPSGDGRSQAFTTYVTYAMEGRGVYYAKGGFVLTSPTIDISQGELLNVHFTAVAHARVLNSEGSLHPWLAQSLEESGCRLRS